MSDESLDDLLSQLSTVSDDSTPQWAIVFMQCFKSVISVLHGQLNQNHDEIALLKQDNVKLTEEIDELKLKIDDQEQRSRNACLLVHGIDESEDENTNNLVKEVITGKLGISLSDIDIQRTHRLGPKRDNRMNTRSQNTRSQKSNPRPIIFRFGNFVKRTEVYNAKKKLKGKGIVITENLTKTRYKLYKATADKIGKGNTWTNEGRIMAKVNNSIISIRNLKDIEF